MTLCGDKPLESFEVMSSDDLNLRRTHTQNESILPTSITIPDSCDIFFPSCERVHTSQTRTPQKHGNLPDFEKCVEVSGTRDLEPRRGSSGPSSPRTSETAVDLSHLVDWDGDDDPSLPQNWNRPRKWVAIALVSAFTFMSPVASSILAPSLSQIGNDLHIQNESVQSLTLSIFVLGFAFGPMILAPLSEIYGRAPVLQASNLLFIVFNLACGFAKSTAQLIIFRLIAGLGGSAPLALGSGVLGDLFTADERGLAVSIYSFFPILGPAIGPICGGFITEYSTWRWGFWGTTIFGFPVLIAGTFFLEETYPPVLLMRKKVRLAKETGNVYLFTKYEKQHTSLAAEIGDAVMRPMKLMTTQILIIVLGLYNAYLYGIMYIVLVSFPKLWQKQYGESVSIGGLNYITLGIGYCLGIQLSSYFQDKLYRKLKIKNNGIGLPEFRAPLMIPTAIMLPIGLFVYGWTAEYKVHWIFPSLGAACFAAGIMIGFNALITYIVDSYPTYSASAIAASSLLRSLAAFVFPLFAPAMYEKLGYGWGNSLLGFVALAIGGPAPICLWLWGAKLRAKSKFATE
ncbi:MFS general substrate transporter [Glarea lozoyensis ATCC 20868]|uniref:MFS general substrate transporter n=1 Tax=Glarea lozoyensis (strain ATCC 20868 / MF5171) TaxID=1116229 RepID=S3CYQ6_GLAL2|nr:MFS general substrate transporter [Glarea lozoyensis ATCC 20868]EPE24961.1 MFS general substrate transporter [Glarea lozoyensis ATCC 20868]